MANPEVKIIISAVDNTQVALSRLESQISSLGERVRGVGLALSGMGAAITGVMGMLVKSAAESDAAWQRVSQQLKNSGMAVDGNLENIQEFASEMQELTGHSDELIGKFVGDLIPVTGNLRDAFDATRIAMDLAAFSGGNLEDATRQMMMVMSGNIEIMRKCIPAIRDMKQADLDAMTAKEKTAFALRAMRKLFEDLAEVEGKTLIGRMRLLKQTFGDLQETLGGPLIPTATAFVTRLTELIKETDKWAKNNKELAQTLAKTVTGIGLFAAGIGGLLLSLPAISWVVDKVAKGFALLSGFIATAAAALSATGWIPLIGQGLLLLAAGLTGLQLGRHIAEWEVYGLKIKEAMQAGYASVAIFLRYAVYAWDTIALTARTAWGQVKEAGKSMFYEFLASLQETYPRLAQFFGLTADYRAKIAESQKAQAALREEQIAGQAVIEEDLKRAVSLQRDIQEGIFREADARAAVQKKAKKAVDDTKDSMDKGRVATVEYIGATGSLNTQLDRLADTLRQVKDKALDFTSEIQKLTASAHVARLIDIEDAYRHDMAAIEKYKTDIDRAVRDLHEKIEKAQTEAAKKNKKRRVDEPVYVVDPSLYAELDEAVKTQQQIHEKVETMRQQADEKRRLSRQNEMKEEEIRIRSRREAEINAILAQMDIEEAAGKYRRENFEERVRLLREVESIQSEALAKMDKMKDPESWYAQLSAINATRKSIAPLRVEQRPVFAELNKYAEEATDLWKQIGNAVSNTFKGMEDAIINFVQTGKLNFRDLANSIVADLLRIQIRTYITGPISSMLGQMFSAFSAGGSSPGYAIAPTGETGYGGAAGGYHGGGIVGGDVPSFYRLVPQFAFAGAPRFHGGFAPDEYPAILQRGEGVFTKAQMAALAPVDKVHSAPVSNQMHNYFYIQAVDARSFADLVARNPAAILSVIGDSDRRGGMTRGRS